MVQRLSVVMLVTLLDGRGRVLRAAPLAYKIMAFFGLVPLAVTLGMSATATRCSSNDPGAGDDAADVHERAQGAGRIARRGARAIVVSSSSPNALA
jgi:hypothetical protein